MNIKELTTQLKERNNKLQIELLYETKKKSMLWAYLIGAFLGSFGMHYFYAGKENYGLVVLISLVLTFFAPQLILIHSIMVLTGLVHTKFVIDEVNEGIRAECEATYKAIYKAGDQP